MMMLLNDYYTIDNRYVEGDDTLFCVRLLPDYFAYAGHFAGNPVAPGVCNIQMIRECAELLAGRQLFMVYIAQCRFSAVITPQTTPLLRLRLHLTKTEEVGDRKSVERQEQLPEAVYIFNVRATLFDDTTTYIDFKGELATRNC